MDMELMDGACHPTGRDDSDERGRSESSVTVIHVGSVTSGHALPCLEDGERNARATGSLVDGGTSTVRSPDKLGLRSPPDLRASSAARQLSSAASTRIPVSANGAPGTAGANQAKWACDCSSRVCTARDWILLPFCLATSALFGVGARYGLEALFAENAEKVTSEWSPIFVDLPPNMIGCFVMGFVGLAWKKHVTWWSEDAYLFLTTGFCGCLTTFASWNQRVAAMFVAGLWVRACLGVLFGIELSLMSLVIGNDVGKAVMGSLQRWRQRNCEGKSKDLGEASLVPLPYPSADNCRRKFMHLAFYMVCWSSLMLAAIVGIVVDTKVYARRKLWVALTFSAPGVLLRWRLATLNRPSISTRNKIPTLFEWLPLGTFVANMLATVLAAMLSGLSFEVASFTTKLLATSAQIGFLGCLSTVSTLMLEVHNLRKASTKQYRAYLYMLFTSTAGICLALLIYGVPVWIYRYPAALPSTLAIGYT